jgi:type II secretory pathway pseudopilin PulG
MIEERTHDEVIAAKRKRSPEQASWQACGLILVIGLWAALALPGYYSGIRKQKENQTRANLHQIQIALDRYYYDHNGVFPVDVTMMVENGYMDAIPINAFSGQPMREIPFGAYPYEGEFTYIPFTKENETKAYYLLAYGVDGGKGSDVDENGSDDHVILVVNNGADVRFQNSPRLNPIAPPPLKDVLKSLKANPQSESTASPENLK